MLTMMIVAGSAVPVPVVPLLRPVQLHFSVAVAGAGPVGSWPVVPSCRSCLGLM